MKRQSSTIVSRARRIVENCFGILVHRWQCLLGTLQQELDTCKLIVKACLCLHNLMRLRYPGLQKQDADQEDAKRNIIPGAWCNNNAVLDEMHHERQGGNLGTRDAKAQRVSVSEMLLQQRCWPCTMARFNSELNVDYLCELRITCMNCRITMLCV